MVSKEGAFGCCACVVVALIVITTSLIGCSFIDVGYHTVAVAKHKFNKSITPGKVYRPGK